MSHSKMSALRPSLVLAASIVIISLLSASAHPDTPTTQHHTDSTHRQLPSLSDRPEPDSSPPALPWPEAHITTPSPSPALPSGSRCSETLGLWDGSEWAVRLNPSTRASYFGYVYDRSIGQSELGDMARSVADDFNLELVGPVESFEGVFKLKHSIERDLELHDLRSRDSDRLHRRLAELDRHLESHPSVLWSSRQQCLVRHKRGGLGFNDPMFKRQWHLVNAKESGHDINVTEVWSNNITGEGVVIAVVDDGLEHTNNDISLNYNASGSYDFNDDDKDPMPNLKNSGDNTHGTKCAGLISAVANNNQCAVGVAYGASVSGIRMLDGKVTDILEAQSFIHKAHINWILSCSWGPEDNGKTVEGPGKLAQEALEMGISKGRYGYGNIYVFASGNGGQMSDNCNFDGYANSIYTLTVGAVDEKNKMPYYAEACPSMLAVTYSNGHSAGDRNIVTTDATTRGGCTKSFSGTSAAAPIASGMVALMLQVRPCLSWRDVQSILVYSAVKVDVSGAEWVENGAGFHHSDQHGFGLMDAYRLTTVARAWPLLPDMGKWEIKRSGGQNNKVIPVQGAPLLITIIVADDVPTVAKDNETPPLVTLEYIAIKMTLTHQRRGDLLISLTSPNGTHSTIATSRKYDNVASGLDGWTFTSSRFWGEQPAGVWVLNITDTRKRDYSNRGVLKDWTLTLYGSEMTPDDVSLRKELVRDVLAEGFEREPLPCPPLPPTPADLSLPLKLRSLRLWEKIVVVILAVIGGALLIHLFLEVFTKRYKLWKRQRSQQKVLFITNSKSEEGVSEDDSDPGETSRLIFLSEERTEQRENGNLQEHSLKMSEDKSELCDSAVLTNEIAANEEVYTTGSASAMAAPDVEWLSAYRGENILSRFDGTGEEREEEEVCYERGVGGGEEVRILLEEGGREGSVTSDGGAWSPIYSYAGMDTTKVGDAVGGVVEEGGVRGVVECGGVRGVVEEGGKRNMIQTKDTGLSSSDVTEVDGDIDNVSCNQIVPREDLIDVDLHTADTETNWT